MIYGCDYMNVCDLCRLWRSQLPRPESMDMLNATLLLLTSLMGRSSKILFHLPTIVMCVYCLSFKFNLYCIPTLLFNNECVLFTVFFLY